MTTERLLKAKKWFLEHREHILNKVKSERKEYPPTLNEDINNPRLWKSAHWVWFINNEIGATK